MEYMYKVVAGKHRMPNPNGGDWREDITLSQGDVIKLDSEYADKFPGKFQLILEPAKVEEASAPAEVAQAPVVDDLKQSEAVVDAVQSALQDETAAAGTEDKTPEAPALVLEAAEKPGVAPELQPVSGGKKK